MAGNGNGAGLTPETEMRETALYNVPAWLALVAALLPGLSAAAAQSRIDTELRSLRALPPGFTSWCEAGHLIFKSPTSARFRIADAALCAGKPDGYVLCAPGGPRDARSPTGRTPSCRDLAAPGT